MAISDKELDYEYHIEFLKRLGHLTGDPKEDAHWHRQAEYMQVLCVIDAIGDAFLSAIALSQKVESAEANMHLRFGVAHRTKFIWFSQRRLLELIHPERAEPLALDSVQEAALNLNVIYINIRGTLDNFAWCLLDLFAEEKTRRLPPARVHLFGDEFLSDANFQEAAAFLKGYTRWNQELKERRDPAAHRIPLSVPPAIVDDSTSKEYAQILGEYNEVIGAALKKGADESADKLALFDKASLVHERLEQVGTFAPIFRHHPSEGYMRIYPTIPQDVGQLVKIARGLTAIILKNLPN